MIASPATDSRPALVYWVPSSVLNTARLLGSDPIEALPRGADSERDARRIAYRSIPVSNSSTHAIQTLRPVDRHRLAGTHPDAHDGVSRHRQDGVHQEPGG